MTAPHWAMLCVIMAVCGSGLACTDTNPKQRAPVGTLQLRGAGATFPAPLYKKWLEEYQKRHPDVQLSYDALGSGEGTKRFMAGAVDSGASDAAMSDEEMAVVARGVQLLPDPDGKESYPIVTFSWLLLYKQYDDHLKAAALKQYVKWCLTEGQAFNESLGYVRLAPQVIAHTMAAVDRIR